MYSHSWCHTAWIQQQSWVSNGPTGLPVNRFVLQITETLGLRQRGCMRAYRGAVAHKDSSSGAVPDIPEADGAVAGACGNVVAVGVPLHHIHIRLVPCSVWHRLVKIEVHDDLHGRKHHAEQTVWEHISWDPEDVKWKR